MYIMCIYIERVEREKEREAETERAREAGERERDRGTEGRREGGSDQEGNKRILPVWYRVPIAVYVLLRESLGLGHVEPEPRKSIQNVAHYALRESKQLRFPKEELYMHITFWVR